MLNSVLWIAHVDVQGEGVQSKTPTADELLANLDPKLPRGNMDEGEAGKADCRDEWGARECEVGGEEVSSQKCSLTRWARDVKLSDSLRDSSRKGISRLYFAGSIAYSKRS